MLVNESTGVSDIAQQLYEQTLVLRSQMGDEAAFEELVRLHSPRLRFFIRKMLHEMPDADDDILQDAWLAVYRSLPKLENAAAFRAWLYRITRDRIYRELKKRRLPVSQLSEAELNSAAEVSPAADERIEELLARTHALSVEHREALVLRFVEEMSYDEIARVTGSSLGTVRSRIHYAKRALRRAFEEKSYEPK